MDLDAYLESYASRHEGLLTAGQQERINTASVCAAGVGGNGGYTCLALAHLGFRRFRLADPDVFQAVNANHQAGCTFRTIGRAKVDVIAERIMEMLPDARVETFPEGVTLENMDRFLEGGDVVLDGIDLYEPYIKKTLYERSRLRKQPVFSSPILGFGTALGIFDPVRSPGFTEYFGEPPDRSDRTAYQAYLKRIGMGFFGFRPRMNWPAFAERMYAGAVPSVGVACLLTGALTASAVADYVLDIRRYPVIPETLHLDLMDRRLVKVGRLRRAFLRRVVGPLLARQERRAARKVHS